MSYEWAGLWLLGWQFGQVKELITSAKPERGWYERVRQGFNVRVQSGLIGLPVSGPCKLDLATYKGCRDAPLDSWVLLDKRIRTSS